MAARCANKNMLSQMRMARMAMAEQRTSSTANPDRGVFDLIQQTGFGWHNLYRHI